MVKVMARPADPAAAPTQEITRLNVWIVWDTVQLEPLGSINADYSFTVAVDGNGDQPATFIDAGYASIHSIVPPEILTAADKPDMTGANDLPVPGATKHHIVNVDRTLADGVASKWDPSQQIRSKFINPNGIAAKYFVGGKFPPDTGYPDDPLEGNDDIYTTQTGSIDPYAHHGFISISDQAGWGIADEGGNIGDTWEYHLQALDFGRAQIGEQWYRISDPHLWRVHFKFKKVGGVHPWISNMTADDMATNNDNL